MGDFFVGVVPACCISENAKEEEMKVVGKMCSKEVRGEVRFFALYARRVGLIFRWTMLPELASTFADEGYALAIASRMGASVLDRTDEIKREVLP